MYENMFYESMEAEIKNIFKNLGCFRPETFYVEKRENTATKKRKTTGLLLDHQNVNSLCQHYVSSSWLVLRRRIELKNVGVEV